MRVQVPLTVSWAEVTQAVGGRCAICPGDKACVGGDYRGCNSGGSRVMCIGEAPGKDEDERTQRPFTGPAGDEFNYHYLELAGLSRDEIDLTNTRKCRPPNNRKPTQEEVRVCGGHFLPTELEVCNPDIVVLMGATACSLANIDVSVCHGMLLERKLFGVERVVFPVYHPALGLHDTGKIRELRDDFTRLGQVLDGSYTVQEPEPFTCELVTTADGVEEPLYGRVAIDTETDKGELWSVQWCADGVNGKMVRVEKGKILARTDLEADKIKERLNALIEWAGRVVLHYAEADFFKINKLGIVLDWSKVDDTMHRAYHLGLAQGLKVLAYRLCGVEMEAFTDLVTPYSKLALHEALEERMGRLPRKFRQLKTKVKEVPNPLLKHYKHVLRHLWGDTYDPWGYMRGHGEVFGGHKWPSFGIRNVPIEEAVKYGCRDAVMTWRVEEKMEKMVRELHGIVITADRKGRSVAYG